MPRPRKGPFKGKGADSRAARTEAPVSQPDAAPADRNGRAESPAVIGDCDKPARSPVQGWTLIGSIAVRTTSLPLAVRAASRVQAVLQCEGYCRISGTRLRWMRLQRFYRHIGALP